MDFKAMIDDAGPWTEERHSSFLNWMEESFVRRMLVGADLRASCSAAGNLNRVPLDRYLPDSATESTRDFHRPRRTTGAGRPMRSPASVDEEEEEEEPDGRTLFPSSEAGDLAVTSDDGRRARKRPLPQYDASQDQVVPQLGISEVDDGNSQKNQAEGEGMSLTASPTSHNWGKKKRG